MKRLVLALSLALSLISLSSFASDRDPDVIKKFYHSFTAAENVNWTEIGDMTRIGFTIDGRPHYAYYSDNQLVVVARLIETTELPSAMQEQLKKYAGYTVGEAYELDKNGRKEYCLTLEKGSHHLVLKGKDRLKVFLQEKR